MIVQGPNGFDDRVEFTYSESQLRFTSWAAGVPTSIRSVPYIASQHLWWRLAEENGKILFQASNGGDFVTFASTDPPFDKSAVKIVLHAGAPAARPPGGEIHFDDLNRMP
jgi:hypothetical protein